VKSRCKRVIGVVIVKNNWAVQSSRFNNYLPLGSPLKLVENLDRWGADEIIIKDIDASANNNGPNFDLIDKIGNLGISTPISYGGGIRNPVEASRIIRMGFERIIYNQLFLKSDEDIFKKIANTIGSQAVIISIPSIIKEKKLFFYNYLKKEIIEFDEKKLRKIEPYYSEIIVEDVLNDGMFNAFNEEMLELYLNKKFKNKLILFGGITNLENIYKYLSNNSVEGVSIGNSLNYKENAIQNIKKYFIKKNPDIVRAPYFEKKIL